MKKDYKAGNYIITQLGDNFDYIVENKEVKVYLNKSQAKALFELSIKGLFESIELVKE